MKTSVLSGLLLLIVGCGSSPVTNPPDRVVIYQKYPVPSNNLLESDSNKVLYRYSAEPGPNAVKVEISVFDFHFSGGDSTRLSDFGLFAYKDGSFSAPVLSETSGLISTVYKVQESGGDEVVINMTPPGSYILGEKTFFELRANAFLSPGGERKELRVWADDLGKEIFSYSQ